MPVTADKPYSLISTLSPRDSVALAGRMIIGTL
jgi:hypothetical protein